MVATTSSSGGFGPHMSPPASQAPKPITEIPGPCEPSLCVCMQLLSIAFRGQTSGGALGGAHVGPSPGRDTIVADGDGARRPRSPEKEPMAPKTVEERERVVVRFAG